MKLAKSLNIALKFATKYINFPYNRRTTKYFEMFSEKVICTNEKSNRCGNRIRAAIELFKSCGRQNRCDEIRDVAREFQNTECGENWPSSWEGFRLWMNGVLLNAAFLQNHEYASAKSFEKSSAELIL